MDVRRRRSGGRREFALTAPAKMIEHVDNPSPKFVDVGARRFFAPGFQGQNLSCGLTSGRGAVSISPGRGRSVG
jgi:hypothetical protein